ncbi:MAG: hypothetical protein MnENMB40S_29020 [Rhizobiaceae bacterium MnEN-MB40S]|nr:MAG: hypothetical protein MnENMB40S_29020 [Rhizobiaceae bacterium MnEN-MB40S]
MFKCIAAVATIGFSSFAWAQENSEVVHWADVGNWSIFADRTLGNACYAVTVYESGIFLRAGFNGSGSGGDTYVAVGSLDWKSIEFGKEYDITFQMDREAPWNGTATGAIIGEVPFLVIYHDNYDFFEEFARKLGIRIIYEGKQIANLSLRGSHAALMSMIECQAVVNEYSTRPKEKDPFKEPSGNAVSGKDPFI